MPGGNILLRCFEGCDVSEHAEVLLRGQADHEQPGAECSRQAGATRLEKARIPGLRGRRSRSGGAGQMRSFGIELRSDALPASAWRRTAVTSQAPGKKPVHRVFRAVLYPVVEGIRNHWL